MSLTKMVNGASVILTPLEEAAELARWKMGDHEILKPQKLTTEQEHEMLISDGVDAVKAKRAEYETNLAQWQKDHQPLVDAHQAAYTEYLKSIGQG